MQPQARAPDGPIGGELGDGERPARPIRQRWCCRSRYGQPLGWVNGSGWSRSADVRVGRELGDQVQISPCGTAAGRSVRTGATGSGQVRAGTVVQPRARSGGRPQPAISRSRPAAPELGVARQVDDRGHQPAGPLRHSCRPRPPRRPGCWSRCSRRSPADATRPPGASGSGPTPGTASAYAAAARRPDAGSAAGSRAASSSPTAGPLRHPGPGRTCAEPAGQTGPAAGRRAAPDLGPEGLAMGERPGRGVDHGVQVDPQPGFSSRCSAANQRGSLNIASPAIFSSFPAYARRRCDRPAVLDVLHRGPKLRGPDHDHGARRPPTPS